MKLRSILLLGLAALAGGCASPNMERIATVQSRAEALYAYGGVATFPVSSELVEISVYAPVHHQREYTELTLLLMSDGIISQPDVRRTQIQ